MPTFSTSGASVCVSTSSFFFYNYSNKTMVFGTSDIYQSDIRPM